MHRSTHRSTHRPVLLAVGAHPDDVELAFGALLLRALRRGWRVVLVDATSGERGRRGSPATRRAEAARAAERLLELAAIAPAQRGALARETHGLPDGALTGERGGPAWFAGLLELHRPDLVLTHAAFDTHADHAALARWAREACAERAGLMLLAGAPPRAPNAENRLAARADNRTANHAANHAANGTANRAATDTPYRRPDVVLGLTASELDAKLALVACHRSQLVPADADDDGGHLPGGLDIVERARAIARYHRPDGPATPDGEAPTDEPLWGEPLWAAREVDRAALGAAMGAAVRALPRTATDAHPDPRAPALEALASLLGPTLA